MTKWGADESPQGEGADAPASAIGVAGPQPVIAEATAAVDFAQIRAIADALPVMIAHLDTEQRYTFLNSALAEWFERPRQSIIGRTAEAVLGTAYEVRKPLIEAALRGQRLCFASDFEHPSRGKLSVRSEYIPHLAPDGNILGMIMVIQDVTEQRAVEQALRESEARFRRIADSAPVPMWVTRLDGSRDFVNDAYVALMGTSREEARTLNWLERIHPDDRPRVIAESRAGEASHESYTVEARFRTGEGEYRWMRAVSRPRVSEGGTVVGYNGVAIDVTMAKEAEQNLQSQVEERTAALSASESRFRAIFNAVMEIVVLLKPDGTVVEVNKTPASWRDDDPRRAIGMPLWESPTVRHHPQHVEALKEGVARAANGEVFQTEVRMEREGVPTSVLDVSIQPVRTEGGDISYLLFEARDISELKQAQDQLRQSQKMEALGQLTGGIAHDFNNLLTVVVGGLDLIAKKLDDERLLRHARNALSAAERGARLTAQLLAFSRVQRLEVKPTYVAPLIEEMRPLLRNVLGPGIEKKFELDSQYLPVMADPTQLEVAVLNLAINARDAMASGGTLMIRSRGRRIDGDPDLEPGNYIELSIEDTGTGMPPDVLARAFEPFFTTKEVGKGTGLGLSMVYGMARQSGGTARIRSEPGKGTSVSLFLRRADEQATAPLHVGKTDEVLRHEGSGARLLVIDDDEEVRAIISAVLRDYGNEVVEAADGAEGIRLFGETKPDLVIIDFVMPGLSGAEVAKRILAVKPDQRILFVSGYSETAAIRTAAPNATILAKPFRPAALDEAVRTVLATG